MRRRLARPVMRLVFVLLAATLALGHLACVRQEQRPLTAPLQGRGPAEPGNPPAVARPPRPQGRELPRLLIIGQKAPDLELPRLALKAARDGTFMGKVGGEKVRLSSVWARKPVCLFLSSYT